MFLQIHFLTSYHASLLNRDDAGLAKRINFGGSPRLRVSSQCQKRHWREWMLDQTALPRGFRTRHFFDRIVKRRLVTEGMDERVAHDLILRLSEQLLATAGEKTALDQETLVMKQPVLFGKPEADYFVHLIQEAADQGDSEAAKTHIDEQMKQGKKNFRILLEQAGLTNPAAGFEGALFGRFVTSDILARVDAPVHVAHAFTTHGLDTEVDFFTVVDDLAGDETGAAHANDMELGGGIFYGYVAVDVPLLVSNLTGCERREWAQQESDDARDLLNLLIHATAQVTPGAKLGATAPYAKAECVVLEVGDTQPRSLANAFLHPIDGRRKGAHPMGLSIEAMAEYMGALDEMYGDDGERRFVSLAPIHHWSRESEVATPLQVAIDQSLEAIFGER
ncbi:MAG TPA: type I-E CRISPR-associated protein Cas7/Cse4/CasC [Firmicutes bacterium]|nr:type I-E CRISPR-associated protein Cas7/Cse4/CasC [Bacillota bacterium]